MSGFVAALPMYDWPEIRADTDAQWARLRADLRRQGIDAPERLARCNADLPPAPGGIVDASGMVVAPDPAALPPDKFDLHALWMHPALLLAQTCWGPMSLGMANHVQVVGQSDYSDCEGGEGEFYASALAMRRFDAPSGSRAALPLSLLQGRRLAYNSADSMSGILALGQDLEAQGESLAIFSERIETGGHRASVIAVAEGRADVAAIDCRSWAMAQRFEPAARDVQIVGWTVRRKGLPFITSHKTRVETIGALRKALSATGMLAG